VLSHRGGLVVANLACELFGRLYPGQYLRVSYEDVASSPREALRELFEAISPDLPVRLAEPEASGNRHQIYGNRMRRQRLRFAGVELDDGWKSEMAPRYRRLAAVLSWPLRLRYRQKEYADTNAAGTQRASARCSANESANQLEGIDR
jgi:hypothetical protein